MLILEAKCDNQREKYFKIKTKYIERNTKEHLNDVGHNLLFNFYNYLILVFLCKICYFRFRLFISLFLGAFNAF